MHCYLDIYGLTQKHFSSILKEFSCQKLSQTCECAFKDCVPKELTSGVIYKFQCQLSNESYYGECIRQFNVRIREHIRKPKVALLVIIYYFAAIHHLLKVLVC